MTKLFFYDVVTLPILSKVGISFILLLLVLSLMVFSHHVYFQLDELNSWLYFVDRGLFVTMAYFPSSNNHIGYNLTSIFWNHFFNPVLAMRMTSILSVLGAVFIFYLILLKRYGNLLSFIGIVFFATLLPVVWYGIQGRGYALELFLLLVLCYVILEKMIDVWTGFIFA